MEMAKKHVYRDAGTGEFVTEEFAKANPGTTVRDTVELADILIDLRWPAPLVLWYPLGKPQ